MRNLLLSTAIGDISGKPYESRRTRTKDYDSVDLLLPENTYSDDTVCTFACADALLNHKDMAQTLKERCMADRHRGYGGRFRQWLDADGIPTSYRSYGNGSAMRVSAAGFLAKSKDECISLVTETEWLYLMTILTRKAVQEGTSPHHLFLQRRETSHEHRQSDAVCGIHSKRTAAENVENSWGKCRLFKKVYTFARDSERQERNQVSENNAKKG